MKSNFTIETLGLTATRILPGFLRLGSGLSLLMSAFSLLISPPFFSKKLFQLTERSATPLIFIFHWKIKISSYCFGKCLESLYIFGAKLLDQWAVTLSLKDGCFQAYLLVVVVIQLPCSLRDNLGTLTDNEGCFPLDIEPSRTMSVCQVYINPYSKFPWVW